MNKENVPTENGAAGFPLETVVMPVMTHDLKTDGCVFTMSWEGIKPYEIRLDDRDFSVGDELVLHETRSTGIEMADGAPLLFTGKRIRQKIISKLTHHGLSPGWCILGVEEMHRVNENE